MPVHDFEVPNLFAAMIGKPEPETDEEADALEQQCIDDFGVDFCGLAEIAERLLPLCEHANAALSGASARGFARGNRFICKVYDDDLSQRNTLMDTIEHQLLWTPVAQALPDTTKKVLATYLNAAGKRRIVIANWVQARTQKSTWDDEDIDIAEYDESSDEFFLKEGWYECVENCEEYGMWWIYEGEVTHWMPMPPSPREKI